MNTPIEFTNVQIAGIIFAGGIVASFLAWFQGKTKVGIVILVMSLVVAFGAVAVVQMTKQM